MIKKLKNLSYENKKILNTQIKKKRRKVIQWSSVETTLCVVNEGEEGEKSICAGDEE